MYQIIKAKMLLTASNKSGNKIKGKVYTDIPNLKSSISRSEYRKFREENTKNVRGKQDKSLINYKSNEFSGFLSNVKLNDGPFINNFNISKFLLSFYKLSFNELIE